MLHFPAASARCQLFLSTIWPWWTAPFVISAPITVFLYTGYRFFPQIFSQWNHFVLIPIQISLVTESVENNYLLFTPTKNGIFVMWPNYIQIQCKVFAWVKDILVRTEWSRGTKLLLSCWMYKEDREKKRTTLEGNTKSLWWVMSSVREDT